MLTNRELEIADLIAQAMSNKDIARALGIAEGTVKACLHNIYGKLGVHTRVQLAVLMITTDRECELVTP